ncbi:MAG: bestrophin family ion channel [Chitinophagaceae bacterium]
MISYNPKDWFVFLFKLHKSDTIRKLMPLLIGVAVYSAIVTYAETNWLHLPDSSHVKSIPVLHSLLGFVISMLLVFRTNTAYDRWWEGRKLWGALVNNSRNLAIKLSAMLPVDDAVNRSFFRKIIPAYAYALKKHLGHESTRISLFDNDEHLEQLINKDKHVPNQVAALMFKHIQQLYAQGKINGDQLIVLNGELLSFTDICGACERIKNTPIPYSYSAFIKKFIFFYVITLPFGYVFSLGYIIVPIVTFVFYVLASLEIIAEEVEDPFGGDENDLPLDKIAANIHRHINELLQ